MTTHHAGTGPNRTRCGRQVGTEQIVDATRRPDCRSCARLAGQPTIGLLRYELEAAIVEASWLTPADRAQVQLARHLADALDRGDLEPRDMTAAARQLTAIYRSLGLSPNDRPEQDQAVTDTGSPLAAIRDASVRPA